jgi:hypothetical protein
MWGYGCKCGSSLSQQRQNLRYINGISRQRSGLGICFPTPFPPAVAGAAAAPRTAPRSANASGQANNQLSASGTAALSLILIVLLFEQFSKPRKKRKNVRLGWFLTILRFLWLPAIYKLRTLGMCIGTPFYLDNFAIPQHVVQPLVNGIAAQAGH